MKDLAALLLPAESRLQFLEEVKAVLRPEQFQRIRAVFEGSAELLGIVETKTLSMSRLCARVFGPKTENGHRLCGGAPREKPGDRKRCPGTGAPRIVATPGHVGSRCPIPIASPGIPVRTAVGENCAGRRNRPR